MVIFRPTAALAQRMKVKLSESAEQSTGILGDWFAQPLVLDRRQYILCTSLNGRLPIIMPAAPYADFYKRMPSILGDVLLTIGIPADKVEQEVLEMNEVKLAKTNNRSILGSIKEFRFQLERDCDLGQLQHDYLGMSVELADMISLVLPQSTPKDTVRQLFGRAPESRRRPPELRLLALKDRSH